MRLPKTQLNQAALEYLESIIEFPPGVPRPGADPDPEVEALAKDLSEKVNVGEAGPSDTNEDEDARRRKGGVVDTV